jgi:hypothetical protein
VDKPTPPGSDRRNRKATLAKRVITEVRRAAAFFRTLGLRPPLRLHAAKQTDGYLLPVVLVALPLVPRRTVTPSKWMSKRHLWGAWRTAALADCDRSTLSTLRHSSADSDRLVLSPPHCLDCRLLFTREQERGTGHTSWYDFQHAQSRNSPDPSSSVAPPIRLAKQPSRNRRLLLIHKTSTNAAHRTTPVQSMTFSAREWLHHARP